MDTDKLVEERGKQYGHPREDFTRTAGMWSAYLGHEIKAEDVPMMMILLKVSREKHKHKDDNLFDIKGYAKTAEMLYEDQDLEDWRAQI
jgi:hypothetical protein